MIFVLVRDRKLKELKYFRNYAKDSSLEHSEVFREAKMKLNYAPRKISLKEIEEEFEMGGRSSIMSDKLKMEIARELGVYDTVRSNGWGDVSSKNCGNMVRKAIEIAEKSAGGG